MDTSIDTQSECAAKARYKKNKPHTPRSNQHCPDSTGPPLVTPEYPTCTAVQSSLIRIPPRILRGLSIPSSSALVRARRKLGIGTARHIPEPWLDIAVVFEKTVAHSILFGESIDVAIIIADGVAPRAVLMPVPGRTSLYTIGECEGPDPQHVRARIVGFTVDGEGHLGIGRDVLFIVANVGAIGGGLDVGKFGGL